MAVREVILAARDARAEFTRQQTGDSAAVRFLERWQRRIAGEIARWRPEAVSSPVEVALPLADFDAGFTIPDHYRVHGGAVFYTNTDTRPEPLELLEFHERMERRDGPAAYIQGRNTLKLIGVAADWQSVSQILLELFPVPTAIAALTEDLSLPGDVEPAASSALASFMAQRQPSMSRAEKLELAGVALTDEEAYLDMITQRRIARRSVQKEVW